MILIFWSGQNETDWFIHWELLQAQLTMNGGLRALFRDLSEVLWVRVCRVRTLQSLFDIAYTVHRRWSVHDSLTWGGNSRVEKVERNCALLDCSLGKRMLGNREKSRPSSYTKLTERDKFIIMLWTSLVLVSETKAKWSRVEIFVEYLKLKGLRHIKMGKEKLHAHGLMRR